MTTNYHINLNVLQSQSTLHEARENDIFSSDFMLIVYSKIVIIVYRLVEIIRYTCLYNILIIHSSYLMQIETWKDLYLV